MQKWVSVVVAVVIAIVVYLISQRTVQVSNFEGQVQVYGTDTCPWCIKQKDYLKEKGIQFEFIDCSKGTCPDFVDGFPTLRVNGEIKNGYTEL